MGASCCPGEGEAAPAKVEAEPSPAVKADEGGDVFEDLPEGEKPEPVGEYITTKMIGPPDSLFQDTTPDWQFELSPGEWRSYPLQESIELDRYWKVYEEARRQDLSDPHLAKVSLKGREGLVNFQAMTCQVGEGRARSLKRSSTASGWLSNRYFFEAFTAALQSAGVEVESEPETMFDFRFNQDFREVKDDGRKLFRGGQPYELPVGWKRFAVNVKGQYDSGDNTWLKEDDTGWAVAYHGTAKDSLPGILCTGFKVGSRQKFEKETGSGVYCTPWIGVAQHYSKPQLHQGHSVQIVLQLRVRPSAIRPIADKKASAFEKKYWVINDPQDIRAYGVLIREHPLRGWVPPEIMVFGKDREDMRQLLKKLGKEVEAQERAADA